MLGERTTGYSWQTRAKRRAKAIWRWLIQNICPCWASRRYHLYDFSEDERFWQSGIDDGGHVLGWDSGRQSFQFSRGRSGSASGTGASPPSFASPGSMAAAEVAAAGEEEPVSVAPAEVHSHVGAGTGQPLHNTTAEARTVSASPPPSTAAAAGKAKFGDDFTEVDAEFEVAMAKDDSADPNTSNLHNEEAHDGGQNASSNPFAARGTSEDLLKSGEFDTDSEDEDLM